MISLAQQRQAIEHCLALLESQRNVSPGILAAARQGCLTLAWLEKRQHLVKAIASLDEQAPQLAALCEAFPGIRLAEVRTTDGGRTTDRGHCGHTIIDGSRRTTDANLNTIIAKETTND